jgi:hypothetical protein
LDLIAAPIPLSQANDPAGSAPVLDRKPEPERNPLLQVPERPEPAPVKLPEPQPEPESDQLPIADNVVAFPAKSKRGRPRKTGDDYRVSVEQVSKHTYAVRLRWKRADGTEDGVVVNRLRADIVKEIQRSKKRYEQFKAQTIASWKSRAVRQSHGA